MNHSARSHARLAPSAAHRWLNCTASVGLSAEIEEAPSVFAAEGTAAHELAEHCVRYLVRPGTYLGDVRGGFKVDHEMVDAVELYIDVVNEVRGRSDEFEIEQRLDLTEFVPGVYGTGDAIAYNEDQRRVFIVDFKYGKGVPVNVLGNAQLLTYALGVARRFHNRGVDEVELVIVQPRAPLPGDDPPGVRRWATDVLTLYEHAMNMQSAAKSAVEHPVYRVGGWCKFCKAAAVCDALWAKVNVIVGFDGSNPDDPMTYDAETLAEKLREREIVKNWLARLEEFAHAEAMRGRMPPGFKLVHGRAYRKWDNEQEASVALQDAGLTDSDLFEMKLCSPAQAEKMLPRDQRDIIKKLASAKPTSTVLALVDDPRPAVDGASGFEAVEIEER